MDKPQAEICAFQNIHWETCLNLLIYCPLATEEQLLKWERNVTLVLFLCLYDKQQFTLCHLPCLCYREFKKWRRQRRRQRHKSTIWLVERAARATRFLVQLFDLVCQTTTWNLIFEVLRTTRARSCKSFIFCLCMKTVRVKQAKVQFAYFLHRDQLGIIAKDLT